MSRYGERQLKRRAGLPNDPNTKPLLSVVNNKPRNMTTAEITAPPESDTETEPSEPGSPVSPAKNQQRASGFTAGQRPIPRTSSLQGASNSKNDSSDEGEVIRRARADMTRSAFGKYHGTSNSGRHQAKAHSASQERKQGQKRTESSQESTTSTTKVRDSKRSSPDIHSSSPPSKRSKAGGSQIDDEVKVRNAKRPQKPQRSFSKRDNDRLKRLEAAKPEAKKPHEKKAAKRNKARESSPKREQPSFKSYDDDPFEKMAGKTSPKRLIQPGETLPSSPVGSPTKSFMRHSSLTPGASPQRAVTSELKHPSFSLSGPLRSPDKGTSTHLRDLESNPKCSLKGRKGSLSDLSDMDMDKWEPLGTTESAETRCPVCREPVRKALLDSFSKNARLNIRKQIQFCRLHKKKSAEDAWEVRGYPEIDWNALSNRLRSHDDILKDIINGSPSYYGALLIDKVNEGKDRTLLKADDSLTPGYYGPRGLRAMSENIISRFSSTLRERAVDDRLISSRGYSSYVQTVLVPELTVRLICEDMGVKPSKARNILEESKWIGDLLHEDIGDTVDQLSDDGRNYS